MNRDLQNITQQACGSSCFAIVNPFWLKALFKVNLPKSPIGAGPSSLSESVSGSFGLNCLSFGSSMVIVRLLCFNTLDYLAKCSASFRATSSAAILAAFILISSSLCFCSKAKRAYSLTRSASYLTLSASKFSAFSRSRFACASASFLAASAIALASLEALACCSAIRAFL